MKKVLDIGIPLRRGIDDALHCGEQIEKDLQLRPRDAGCGFGFRDMQIPIGDKDEKKIVEEVKTILRKCHLIKGSYVSVYDEDEEVN